MFVSRGGFRSSGREWLRNYFRFVSLLWTERNRIEIDDMPKDRDLNFARVWSTLCSSELCGIASLSQKSCSSGFSDRRFERFCFRRRASLLHRREKRHSPRRLQANSLRLVLSLTAGLQHCKQLHVKAERMSQYHQ